MTHNKFHRKLATERIVKNAEYRKERRQAAIKQRLDYNARPFKELLEERLNDTRGRDQEEDQRAP